MGKAALAAEMFSLSASLTALNAEILELEAAKQALSGIQIDFEYLLKDANSIESSYHLGGEKYTELAESEEETVDNLKARFEKEQADMEAKLSVKIMEKSMSASSLRAQISVLSYQMSVAKED